jgi:hypothetical protein
MEKQTGIFVKVPPKLRQAAKIYAIKNDEKDGVSGMVRRFLAERTGFKLKD